LSSNSLCTKSSGRLSRVVQDETDGDAERVPVSRYIPFPHVAAQTTPSRSSRTETTGPGMPRIGGSKTRSRGERAKPFDVPIQSTPFRPAPSASVVPRGNFARATRRPFRYGYADCRRNRPPERRHRWTPSILPT
jgi:hypothetical protein